MKDIQSGNILPVMLLFLTIHVNSIAHDRDLTQPDTPSIEGRWDITLDMSGTARPGWLEIIHSGNHALVGQVVVIVGSARPISEVHFKNGKMNFSIPPQWERGDNNLVFEGTLKDDRLMGTMINADGKQHSWTAVRAPALRRRSEPIWGEPIRLFNRKDLSGWTTLKSSDENQWVAEDGILRNPKSGANLRTEAIFDDFKLHIEFRYPKGSNSGVYLRGRYEVQIEDNKGREPNSHLFGGIYGFLSPSEMVAKDPEEWQTFDITLVGRMLTVIANGITIICNQEIPGITGGAIDSHEGEPGPIYFQGDHGPIEFRNIVLIPGR